MVKVGAAIEMGVDVMVVLVVVDVLVVAAGVEGALKRLGPLTAANGEVTAAYARKPPPPCVHVSSYNPTNWKPRVAYKN